MKKLCLNAPLLFILSFFVFPLLYVVNAASLSLTHIGSLSTGGATYSEWWYTGTSFTLKGTAANGASVSINIDGDTEQATSDSSGNWSYAVSLTKSDYDVTISSGSESYSFILHAGQYVPENINDSTMAKQTTQSTSAVPPTGYSQILGILISMTLASAGLYLYLQGRQHSKKSYAKSVLESLE